MYRALIVDDDRTIRYMLKRYKRWDHFGFKIEDEASSGKEALKKLTMNAYDLVITDIKMPGMDGLELLHEVNSIKYEGCVMLLSTHSEFEYAQRGMRLGAFDYMLKPVEEETLDEALGRAKTYLDEKLSQEESKQKLTDQLKESFELYYPHSREKNLIALLKMGEQAIIKEAEEVIEEVFCVFEQDPFKTGMMLENLLLKVWESLCASDAWVAKVERMEFEGSLKDKSSLKELKEKFLEIMERMLETVRKYELHQTDSMIKKACEYVIEHVEEDIHLSTIAEEIHMNKDYIGKLFKQKTGYSFNEYVTKIKMEHGKYLLGSGQYKNYEVSDKLGYSTPDYFARLFKNYTGYTPAAFRKQTEL